MISWSRFLQPISRRKLAKLVLASPLIPVRSRNQEFDVERSAGVNPWNHLSFKNNAAHFHFAIVPDLTGRERPGVFQDAVRKLNLLRPEFAVTIGDVIEGHTNDSAQLNRDWDQFFEAVKPLEIPLFYIPGNHDYWYQTTQNWDGSREVYDMAEVYKKRVGRSYYHFIYKDVLFLILNNSMGDPAEREAEKQYITTTLTENSDVRWTFTFFHYPSWFSRDEIWQHTAPLLSRRPFTAFAGNSHQYVSYERNGRDYIEVATTGGMSRLRGPKYGEFDHLVWITMTDEGPRIANLMLDGIYDKNVRTERSKALTSQLLRNSPLTSSVVLENSENFQFATTRFRVTNRADVPLTVEGTFEPHVHLSPEPAFFQATVPPKSEKTVDLRMGVGAPVPVDRIHALVMNWEAGYKLTGNDPDVEVAGQHRILIDTSGERPRPRNPVIKEDFVGPHLHAAWRMLGSGGAFNGKGQFLLKDDPNAPDAQGDHYKYTDGRGLYTLTPLWHLPLAGMFRDIPADSFEAYLKVTDIQWRVAAAPVFRWEFWDDPDREYNYGPSYLSGVILQIYREGEGSILQLQTFTKRKTPADAGVNSGASRVGSSQFPGFTEVGRIALDQAPVQLALRADWRESTRTWRFFFGVNGEEPTVAIGPSFVDREECSSPDGKRNLIYVRKAEGKPGFSVNLDEYRVLHY